jgi:predicted DCC family thiol-disulfide oxidoreductase YuxK
MNRLFVFYDERCAFCCWCRDWISTQGHCLPIEFRARPKTAVRGALHELPKTAPQENLAVFSDTGLVYTGDQALIIILWALRDWRGWSRWLGRAENRHLAGRLWDLIQHEPRIRLSILRGTKTPDALSLDRFQDKLLPCVPDRSDPQAKIICEA